MKRVNLRVGLKQRINDILGTDYSFEGNVPGITPWSVQAAMLDNIRRVVSGVAGSSGSEVGRAMKGMWITGGVGGSQITITEGVGFTRGGNAIVLSAPVQFNVNVSSEDIYYIYAKHSMGVVDGDTYEDGKKTGFIGKTTPENIVYDDLAASVKDNLQPEVNNIVIQSEDYIIDDDHVYLGSVDIQGGQIVAVNQGYSRGFDVNPDNFRMEVPGLNVNGTMFVTERAQFADGLEVGDLYGYLGQISVHENFVFFEDVIFDDAKTVWLPGGDGNVLVGGTAGKDNFSGPVTNITIKNGIVTAIS